MTDEQRMKRIERAQMRVLFQVPFFAPGVAKLPVRFDDAVATACTNGKEMVFGREFADKLPDAVLPTIICHEVAHCLLGHLWRAPDGANFDVWNQACDHAVNLMLGEFGAQVTARGLADPFPFPDPKEAYCCNPAFSGMNEEKIYQILKARQPSGGGGQGQGQGQGQGGGQPAKPGQPGQSGGSGGKPGPHSMPVFGQFAPDPTADPQSAKATANSWDQTMVQCAAMAKGQGSVPGCVGRYVTELFSPKVPWWELVRAWLREQASDDWNWLRPNQYFDESGFILPSLDNERIGVIVTAKDSSGSVDHEVLAKFVCEQQACLDDLKPSLLVDIICDAQVHKVTEYRLGDTISGEAPGGGGTDFRPIFEHCEGLAKPPKCLVVLTDLDGRFPDKAPDYPVLWVVYNKGSSTAPFGEVVEVE